MGEGTDRLRSRQDEDDTNVEAVHEAGSSDAEQTRAEMSETIDAIQERLAPERLTDEAKDMATEVTEEARVAVNEAIEKVKETFPELTGQAEQAARDVIDHALQEAKSSLPVWSGHAQETVDHILDHALQEARSSLPVLSGQAQETVDHIVDHAIQEAKAAIRDLGTQARASVRDATIGKVERMADTTSQTTKSFSSSVVTTIKQNPGPAALTALGIGWLVMNGSGSGSQGTKAQASGSTGSGVTDSVQAKVGGVQGTVSDIAGQAQDAVTHSTDGVQDMASDVASEVQDKATATAGQVQETAGQVTDAAGNVVGGVQSTASAAAGQIQETAGQLTNQVQNLPSRLKNMIDANPVPLSLVAVALGSAAALAVPETQREQELLGGTRDKLFAQAQSTAQDVVDKVKNVAEEAGEAVEKEAKYQGLSPES